MSELTTIKLELNEESSLMAALKQMGFNPVLYKNGVKINTYYDGREKPTAHIVISKKDLSKLGSFYTDIGFEKKSDGTYALHIDSMDTRKFDLKKLNRLYGEARLMKVVNGSSKYSLKSRSDEKNQTRIRLNVNY